jgi:hypothetical protein
MYLINAVVGVKFKLVLLAHLVLGNSSLSIMRKSGVQFRICQEL